MPTDGRVWYVGAQTYSVVNDAAKFEPALLKTIELDPGNPAPYAQLARSTGGSTGWARLSTSIAGWPRSDRNRLVPIPCLAFCPATTTNVTRPRSRFSAPWRSIPVAANNLAYLCSERENGNLDVALKLANTANGAMPSDATMLDTLR